MSITLQSFRLGTTEHRRSSWSSVRLYFEKKVFLLDSLLGWNQSCDVWSVGCIIFELAMGFMMFDTHSSLEHLAMMERILGPLPTKMAEKSKLKYFSKGSLKWDEESSSGRHVRKKVKPLQRYIPREFREDQDWLDMFQLIGQMLRYDPNKRLTLKEALDHPFLKKLKTRGPSSRSNSSYLSR